MRKQRGSPRGEAGQTLLEILLAFSILILALGAVIFGVTAALSNAQYAKNQNLANSYAQEGMTVVRRIRDSGQNIFDTGDDDEIMLEGCIDENLVLSEDGDCLDDGYRLGGIFSRKVEVTPNSSDCSGETSNGTKVIIRVSWSDGKCPAGVGNPLCHKVEIITCFADIERKQNP